jgi:hypothetical protein
MTVVDVVEAYARAVAVLISEPRALAKSVAALIRMHCPAVWAIA